MSQLPDPNKNDPAIIATLHAPPEAKEEILEKLKMANILSKVGGGRIKWSSRCVKTAFQRHEKELIACYELQGKIKTIF